MNFLNYILRVSQFFSMQNSRAYSQRWVENSRQTFQCHPSIYSPKPTNNPTRLCVICVWSAFSVFACWLESSSRWAKCFVNEAESGWNANCLLFTTSSRWEIRGNFLCKHNKFVKLWSTEKSQFYLVFAGLTAIVHCSSMCFVVSNVSRYHERAYKRLSFENVI